MSRPGTVVCFGEALIDFLAKPAGERGESPVLRQFAGGAPANAAVVVAKLGGRCEFVGMLGQDMFGDFLLQSLRDAGVGVQHVRTGPGLYRDEADRDWNFSGYRGQNANMHMCEAMLAAYEAGGERRYLVRALLLADHMTRR